jgi:hypothetical protein
MMPHVVDVLFCFPTDKIVLAAWHRKHNLVMGSQMSLAAYFIC